MNMEIKFAENQRIQANYKGFYVATDQPIENGGDESAPTPFDLFLASIGTCMGYYARRFCDARNLATDGLELSLDFHSDPSGKEIRSVAVAIRLPESFPLKYRGALRAAIESCAVKRQMDHPPRFEVEFTTGPLALAIQ